MGNPLVTVYTLVYNHEKFLRQCLDGLVMQQTNFKYECFVHDDASTDNSAKIILEYAENYPEIIRPMIETNNQWSKGDGSLNRIIFSNLKGKYVAICEGDDFWTDPQKLQKQVDFLERHNDYVMCSHDFKVYNEKERKIIFQSAYPYIKKFPFTYDLNNFFQGDWTQTLTCMYRNIITIDDISEQKYKFFRDRIIFYYVLKKGKGALLRENMGVYRQHAGGILSGKKAEENYYIYMSLAIQLYRIENEYRAFQMLKRHALGLLNLRWNSHERKKIFDDFRYISSNVPPKVTASLFFSFFQSLIINKFFKDSHWK